MHSCLVLIDTKRSATNYPNWKDKLENTVYFYLDNKPNEVNDFLLKELDKEVADKKPVRVVEYTSRGSTVIMDCGDHHAVGMHADVKGKILHLRRLSKQTDIVHGMLYKHPSETCAHMYLDTLFPSSTHMVRYEPLTVNLLDMDIIIGGNTCVHSYNPDFSVRDKTKRFTIGVEVKNTLSAWDYNAEEAKAKILAWKDVFGTECVVLIMNPEPKFYKLDGPELVELKVEDVIADINGG